MDITTLSKALPFLAPFAAIFMFWGQIQSTLHRIFNLFIVEMDLQGGTAEAMSHFLLKNAKQTSFGHNSYIGLRDYLKPLKKEGVYGIKKTQGQAAFFWYGGNLIYMSPNIGRDKKTDEYYENRMKIFFLRGTFDSDKLIEKSVDGYNEYYGKYSSRFSIHLIAGIGNKTVLNENSDPRGTVAKSDSSYYYFNKIIKYRMEDIGYGSKDIKDIPYVFGKESEEILEDMKKWKMSESWYRSRGILWRRGTLLHGIPGSGKTATIRACAQTLELPVYIYDLASLSNLEFINAWKQMLSSMPCVAVFEDIDAVFEGRENKIGKNGGGLSFDCLLNAIGGSLPAEGVYTFVTTNHVDKIDYALGVPDVTGKSSRNGRLDNMVKMNYISKESKIKIADKIFEGTSVDKEKFINIEEEITASRFVEICTQEAIKVYWSKNPRNWPKP